MTGMGKKRSDPVFPQPASAIITRTGKPLLMQTAPSPVSRPTHVRHIVLGVTVAVYMITYMDRSLVSTALPAIRQDLGISLITAGSIISAFRWAYAIFQIPGGWLGDRIGPRRALTLIVAWWSAFTALTGLAWNATSMIAIQGLFGMGEAGAFPIATRSLSRWMLPRERGFAQGVTHAGSRLGAALTRPLAAALIVGFGWRFPFFTFAALGLLWAVLWFVYYRDTPDTKSGNSGQLAFYGIANYQAHKKAFDRTVMIDTPLTADDQGNIGMISAGAGQPLESALQLAG